MSHTLEPTTRDTFQSAEPQLRRWTREEYVRMSDAGVFGDGERVELIEGEIYTMVPQKSPHFAAIGLAEAACQACFGAGYWVRVQGPIDIGARSMPEPDIAVVRGSPRDYRDQHPTAALLVTEISETTLHYDRTRKASMYARFGLQDYWIVNLIDTVLEVRRQPCENPLAAFGWDFATTVVYAPGQSVAPLASAGAMISVDDLLP